LHLMLIYILFAHIKKRNSENNVTF